MHGLRYDGKEKTKIEWKKMDVKNDGRDFMTNDKEQHGEKRRTSRENLGAFSGKNIVKLTEFSTSDH